MKILIALLFLSFASLSRFAAQEPQAKPAAGTGDLHDEDYRIGSGDVVDVVVLQAAELSREYRVSGNGTIELPFLGQIKAQTKTSRELATTIANGLRGDYLVDPHVSVTVKQFKRQFFIQGAVRLPGVYYIEKPPSLLELITLAGGLSTSYGATAFIIRNTPKQVPEGSEDADHSTGYELRKANLNALLRGEFKENVRIEPGDIVHVPPADVFFVAGEVKAPGSFALKEATTLRQAISLAQGTSATASPSRAVIFREDAGGKKLEIPIDVGAVMRGRLPDVPIIANDIIVVPNSKAKSIFMPALNAFGVSASYIPSRIIP